MGHDGCHNAILSVTRLRPRVYWSIDRRPRISHRLAAHRVIAKQSFGFPNATRTQAFGQRPSPERKSIA